MVRSTWPYHHWSSLRCRSHTLSTPPRVALCVHQVRCLWRFRRANYLHHVVLLLEFGSLPFAIVTLVDSTEPHRRLPK